MGALCGECDLGGGKSDGTSYARVGSSKCGKCETEQTYFFLLIALVVIVIFVITTSSVLTCRKTTLRW